MEDASGDVMAVDAVLPDLYFDLDFLDGLDLDFDDLAEFCVGGGGSFLAAAGTKKGEVSAGLELELESDLGSLGGDEGGGREGSPDSVVTDDGTLESGAPEDDAMSSYVSELERFLMEDDDDGGRKKEDEFDADDHEYFFGDLLADDDDGVEAAAGDGVDAATAEEEESLAAHEDEATSRKRARQIRRGASMPNCLSEKPVATRRHGISIEHVGCMPAPWLPPARALQCM